MLKLELLCRSLERKGCVLDCFHEALCLAGAQLAVCVKVKKGLFWFSQFKVLPTTSFSLYLLFM